MKSDAEADTEKMDWPLSASWGHQTPHKVQDTVHVVNEGILAYELLLALQVCLSDSQSTRLHAQIDWLSAMKRAHRPRMNTRIAVQGIMPAILRLESEKFKTESLSQASLSNLLKPSIQSGANFSS